ncbi:MAG: hypothetical protein MZU95_01060 [Desulfomicrobium escambiense]|nr:hypothetical protein [Desulfomicrobium escambiense]
MRRRRAVNGSHAIAYCYEVDGACPCDDTICRLCLNAECRKRKEELEGSESLDRFTSVFRPPRFPHWSQAWTDDRFMGEALKEARKALARGEFPVGCVLVYRGRVVARGRRKGTPRRRRQRAGPCRDGGPPTPGPD